MTPDLMEEGARRLHKTLAPAVLGQTETGGRAAARRPEARTIVAARTSRLAVLIGGSAWCCREARSFLCGKAVQCRQHEGGCFPGAGL